MTRISIFLFVFILLFSGCTSTRQSGEDMEFEYVGPQKAELLKKIDRNFEDPETHYQLGKLYQQDYMYSQAEYQFRVAMQFDPVHHKAQAALVKTLLDNGKRDEAQLSADLYLKQASTTAKASTFLGRAFQAEDLDEYAIRCFHQALTLAPNSAMLHRYAGYHYLDKGDTIRAEEYLRRSIQIDPYQPEVAEQLGRMGVHVQVPRKLEESKNIDKQLDDMN